MSASRPGYYAEYDARPERKSAHLARVKATYARMTDAERFVFKANNTARSKGLPGRLVAADLPPNPECAYCGVSVGVRWDHIIPVARGGENTAANLAPACGTCNRSKRWRTPEQWLAAGLYHFRQSEAEGVA